MSDQHQSGFRSRCRALVFCGILLLLSAPSFADDPAPFLAQLKGLSFSDGEIQNLEDIVLASYQTIVQARAEVSSDRAVMTRQLLTPSTTVKDVEPTMRHSIEAEMKIRLAELDRQLKIRRLIGDKRWAKLMDLSATLKKQTAAPEVVADDIPTNRVINVLRVLGS